jgi:hypothetical protein
MEIVKPIVVIGTGRSGTSVFHRMLSEHPKVSWLSRRLCDTHPDKPALNRFLMRAIDCPAVGRLIKRRVSPGECYSFWQYYCKGFSRPCRDLLSSDVTERSKKQIRHVMSKMLTQKRSRLLIKITGWPRIGFLSEIFKDAKFIHILRDGRAVANSLLNIDWWWGWRGPENWRWGVLSPEQKEQWDRYDKSFAVLAAIQWKILIDAIENAKDYIEEDNFLEIKYEDLCSDPIAVFRKAVEFCNLEWTRGFETKLKRYELKNTNNKWQRELTSRQKSQLEQVLQDHLRKYGYLTT